MPRSIFPQWFVSDRICALCDPERHLAHIVKIGAQWFAFDATHPNREGLGFSFLGSFVRKMTAMEAAESETLYLAGPIAIRPVAPKPRTESHMQFRAGLTADRRRA